MWFPFAPNWSHLSPAIFSEWNTESCGSFECFQRAVRNQSLTCLSLASPCPVCTVSTILDPEVRTELNLTLEVLCRPKGTGKRCSSEALPDQLWVTCILFLSIVVSWLWKCILLVSFQYCQPWLKAVRSLLVVSDTKQGNMLSSENIP